MKTSELNLSSHAAQVLVEQGMEDLLQLCSQAPATVKSWNRCAGSTLRAIGRACLQVGRMPAWLKTVAREFEYAETTPLTDYMPLAGPYGPCERHMLEAAIVQLGPVKWAVTQEPSGLMLWRSRVGYLAVAEEEEL